MGTTVTPNLGLIKPDLNESIKADGAMVGWAAQNTINMDKLDALFRGTTATFSGFAWTADSANPVLGTSGFIEAKYIRLWSKLVVVYFRIYCGTAAFTPGTGTYRLNLPFAIATGFTWDDVMPVGKAHFRDDSAALTAQNLTLYYNHPTTNIFATVSAGTLWTGASPVALAIEDRISGYYMYPTDDA